MGRVCLGAGRICQGPRHVSHQPLRRAAMGTHPLAPVRSTKQACAGIGGKPVAFQHVLRKVRGAERRRSEGHGHGSAVPADAGLPPSPDKTPALKAARLQRGSLMTSDAPAVALGYFMK